MITIKVIFKLTILVLVEIGQDSLRVSANGCWDSVSTGRCHEYRWDGHNCSLLRWNRKSAMVLGGVN